MALLPYDPRKTLNVTERQYVLPTGFQIAYATSHALDATKPVFLMVRQSCYVVYSSSQIHGVSFHKEVAVPLLFQSLLTLM